MGKTPAGALMPHDTPFDPQASVDRFQRVREIFDAAADAPPEQRADLVIAATADDPTLRDDVLPLLDIFARDANPWDHAPLFVGTSADPGERVGQVIGRYRLVRLIGHGGMGTVYEGVRADDTYEQRVAVKLVAPQLGVLAMASRFRHERQILASLEHRNIARILDGGATEPGEPFFVMEYVEGTPITEHCRDHRLSVDDRLRLFLQVCAAVQHAHGKLVVHRDLKPANMLVAHDGSVKLLDFGVAQLLGPRDGTSSLAGQIAPRALTPEYASPEQLRDGPVSTASDVYSLGVVLYELLAGRRPFSLTGRSVFAALRAVEQDAPKPSRVAASDRGVTDPHLDRSVPGEVDDIVGKALRIDPAERYESVEQMADDIRRHLDGRPVLAHADGAGYRARKYVERHWAGMLAGSVAVAALIVALVVSLLQVRRVEIERARAAHISAFLQQMLAAPDATRASPGSPPRSRTTISDMLDDAAARAGVVLASDPPVESAVRQTLGRTYVSIGRYDAGVAQLTRAVAIERRIDAPALPDIATTLIELGDAQLERGDNRAADTLFRADLDICRTHDPRADTTHMCVVGLNDLGGATWFENRLAESEQLYREALPGYQRAFGPDSPKTAIVLGNLGGVLDARGDLAGAEQMYRASLAVYAKAGGEYLPQRAFTLGNLADNLAQRGQFVPAESLVREAIDVISRSQSPDHPDAGIAWIQLGAMHRRTGDLKLARAETDRGLGILALSPAIARRLFVKTRTEAALLLLAEHKSAGARATLAIVLDSASVEFTPDDPRFAEVQAAVGQTMLALDRRTDAVAWLSASYATYFKEFGPAHPATIAVQRALEQARTLRPR